MKTIYDLKLHESIWIREINYTIIKVPNGWIYEYWDSQNDRAVSPVFVPYSPKL